MMDLKLLPLFLTTILTVVLGEEAETQNIVGPENQTTIVTPNVGSNVNEFGYKLLLTMMKQDLDTNVVISPTSITGLLAMTLLGTVGPTFNELANSLGFSQDVIENRMNHEQFGDLLLDLNCNNSSKTLYADAVFVNGDVTLRGLFKDYLSRVYNGEAVNVDFKQTAVVKDIINEWVKLHTEGILENFLLEPLPVDTKVVLLSALYFRGQWLHPFLPEHTLKMSFKKPLNEVMSDQMLNLGSFNYVLSEEYGCQMIALPYNDSVTTMYVLKPIFPDQLSILDLMNSLDYAKIDNLINQMVKSKSIIRFPKMELQKKVHLEKPLQALGVQSLFKPGVANFGLMADTKMKPNKTEVEIISRINADEETDSKGLKELLNGLPNPGLHVDSVLHDVKLTINEFGTEAAAATAGILARTAKLFYVDSPFYMFIRNELTGLVTFSAVIFDPTA